MRIGTSPRFSVTSLLMIGIVVLGFVIRLVGLGWGLPDVYEEATPLKVAWGMWNWDRPAGVDLNPHFFNYPGLMIYVHFALQGVEYVAMKVSGGIESSLDYQVRFLLDPTTWYLAGRFVSTLFAIGTLLFTFLIGRRLAGSLAGILAALFLAVNAYHIERSQMIEVDLPLTFGVVFALWAAFRIVDSPNRRNYLVAGLAIGIASSIKYTGALLILPVVTAHLLARRRPVERQPLRAQYASLLYCLLVAAITFAVSSPYVILDFNSFWSDFSVERAHMAIGHFGLGDESSLVFYFTSLVERMLGWPLFLLGMAGFVLSATVERRPSVFVLSAFTLPYIVAISTWSMHADRYLLPLLPVFLAFAGVAVRNTLDHRILQRLPVNGRSALIAALVVAVVVPALTGHATRLRSVRSDPRTAVKDWIELNVPSGSWIVKEPYGPELFATNTLLDVQPEATQMVMSGLADRPMYPVQVMQMYQARPENSAVFYDPALYENADFLITSSFVRSRYLKDPDRFRKQVAFYEYLDREFYKVKEFRAGDGAGPVQTVYRNPAFAVPFSKRQEVISPRRLNPSQGNRTGSESSFYYHMGQNFDLYYHAAEALRCYDLAFEYSPGSGIYGQLVMRKTVCLVKLKRHTEVKEFVEHAIETAPDNDSRRQIVLMRDQLSGDARR